MSAPSLRLDFRARYRAALSRYGADDRPLDLTRRETAENISLGKKKWKCAAQISPGRSRGYRRGDGVSHRAAIRAQDRRHRPIEKPMPPERVRLDLENIEELLSLAAAVCGDTLAQDVPLAIAGTLDANAVRRRRIDGP